MTGRARMLMLAFLSLCACGSFGGTQSCQAAAFQAGNLVLATDRSIFELTPGGGVVQTFTLPQTTQTDYARDLAVDSHGILYVYDGTFVASLVRLDPVSGVITRHTAPNWGNPNNGKVGRLAVAGDFVFVTDDWISGDLEHGIIRFDTANGFASQRFLADQFPTDVTLGGNGVLYVVNNNGRRVDGYDPVSMALLETRTLDVQCFTIAVDAWGGIYGCGSDGAVHRIDAGGHSIERRILPLTQFAFGIEMREDGRIVVSSTGHPWGFMLTDRYLAPVETHLFSTWSPHAAWVPGALPTATAMKSWGALKSAHP